MPGYHDTVKRDNGLVREEFYLLHDVAFGLADWPASYVVLDAFAAILRAHLFRLHPFDVDIVVSSPSYGVLQCTVAEVLEDTFVTRPKNFKIWPAALRQFRNDRASRII